MIALLKIKYRRSADKGYEDLRNMILDIEDVNQLEALKNEITMISDLNIETQKDELIKSVEQIEQSLKSINGTYDITNPLSKLKKELKRKSLNISRIEKNSSKMISAYNIETAWRKQAKETHLVSLRSLEELIRGNIGLRKQPQIPKEQAKEILYCQTFHKDLSLYF